MIRTLGAEEMYYDLIFYRAKLENNSRLISNIFVAQANLI